MTVTDKGAILVVDDTQMSLKLLTTILAAEGYQVRAADSGELALASVAAMPPALILLDILMPDMDGFEVLRRLQAQEATRRIPVIFLSAITEVAQRVEGLKLGAVDFISKPFQQEELLARVRTHLELFQLRARLEFQAADLRLVNEQLQIEITDRLHAEAQIKIYAEELEQKNEEIKQFAYIVSHDLRASLVNLKGFSAELRSGLEVITAALDDRAMSCLEEKMRPAVAIALKEDLPEALGFIESSVTRMDQFTGAVLTLSRLGRRELYFEPLDMNGLVKTILDSLAHQIGEQQITIAVTPLPGVVADHTSMEQIMGNLLNNAVNYLEPERPGSIEIFAEQSDDKTTFHIRDNGRGVRQEDMPKVFAPFRRAGKQDKPGEGMGLAYVQTLVRRHGGRIWCESEFGVGTTFSLTISNYLATG